MQRAELLLRAAGRAVLQAVQRVQQVLRVQRELPQRVRVLLQVQRQKKHLLIHLLPTDGKADLQESRTMQKLMNAKGSALLGKL